MSSKKRWGPAKITWEPWLSALSGEGASEKSEQVMLTAEAKDAFWDAQKGLSWGSCVGFC